MAKKTLMKRKDKRKLRHLEDRLKVISKRLEKYPHFQDLTMDDLFTDDLVTDEIEDRFEILDL